MVSLVWTSVGAALERIPNYPLPPLPPPAVQILLGILAFAAMAFRRRWPFSVAVLTIVFGTFSYAASGPSLVALISMATHRRWWQYAAIYLLLVLDYVYALLVTQQQLPNVPSALLTSALVMALVGASPPLAIGAYVGARRDLVHSLRLRAEHAEREQAARVSQARATERTTIAREMHDILAHRMSLIAMHAGALSYRDDLDQAQVRQSATLIQETAHTALEELRHVLGVLRSDSPLGLSPEPPQPTWSELPDLITGLRSAGMTITVVDESHALHIPEEIGRQAYRILQECCTNARKHAPGQPVSITFSQAADEELLIEVSNPLPPQLPGPAEDNPTVPGSGLGLVGIDERTTLIGGRVDHRRTKDNRYRVRAWLPCPKKGEAA